LDNDPIRRSIQLSHYRPGEQMIAAGLHEWLDKLTP
jgi:hypothetical protein